MSLSATGNTQSFSVQQLQSFMSQARQKGGLSEELQLQGDSVSLEQLQSQCQGHPELERVVQQFIQTQDQLQMSGSAGQSYEFNQQASFPQTSPPPQDSAPPTADSLRQYQALNSEVTDLKAQLQSLQSHFSQNREQITRISQRIREIQPQMARLEEPLRQLAARQGKEMTELALSDPSQWGQLADNSPINRVLNTLASEAGPASNNQLMDFGRNLNLNEGNSFVYAMLITQGLKNRETSAQVAGVLDKCQQGKTGQLSPAEQAQLHTLGLHVKDGKLLNLVTKKELSQDDISKLNQTLTTLRAAEGSHLEAGNQALTHLRGVLTNVLNQSAALNESRQHLDARIQELEQATQQLEQANGELVTLQDQLQGAQQQQDTQLARLTDLASLGLAPAPGSPAAPSAGAAGEGAPPADLAQSLAQLTPEKISHVNASLQPFGLALSRGADGQIAFRKDGQPIDAASFWKDFQGHLQHASVELERLSSETQQLYQLVTQQTEKVQQTAEKVQTAQLAVNQAASHHNEEIIRAGTTSTEAEQALASLEKDPALAGLTDKLPMDLKGLLRQPLQGLTRQVEAERAQQPSRETRMNSLFSRTSRVREQVGTALARTPELNQKRESYKSRIRNFSRALANFSPKMGEYLNKLFQKPVAAAEASAKIKATQEEIAARVETLTAEADRLQAQLQLAQAPVYKGLDEITADLDKLVDETHNVFEQLHTSESGHSSAEQQSATSHTLRLLDNTAYHSRKLKELKDHSQEDVARALAQALKQLRGDLFVSRSVLAQ